jgi:hypothetical protein
MRASFRRTKIGSASRCGSHLEPLPGAIDIRTEIAERLLLMAEHGDGRANANPVVVDRTIG